MRKRAGFCGASVACLLLTITPQAKAATDSQQCPPRIAWQRSFGGTNIDSLYAVKATADGGVIAGGYSESPPGGNKTAPFYGRSGFPGGDFWVVRLDATGDKLWEAAYGGTASDVLTALQQTTDGGYILAGHTYSGVGGIKATPNYGDEDYWVVRIDSTGALLWERTLGGHRGDFGTCVLQTRDGGFLVGGYSFSDPSGNKTTPWYGARDIWLVRLNPQGDIMWDRSYGGSLYDSPARILQIDDGGFLLAGWSNSGISANKSSPNHGDEDFWIVRIDAQGNRLWDQSFGGTRTDILNSIDATSDGGFILAGNSYSSPGGNKTSPTFGFTDFWVVRVDALGNLLWDRSFGRAGYDFLFDVLHTSDGGFVLAGDSDLHPPDFDVDAWLLRLDAEGQLIWQTTVGGLTADRAIALARAGDGGFLFGGNSESAPGRTKASPLFGAVDYWLVKFQPEPPNCDSDSDGVPDDRDQCPNSPPGAVVNAHGCSIAQLCPCEGPWQNHSEYVQCVMERAGEFFDQGLIDENERKRITRAASRSDCGKRPPPGGIEKE
jgi:hypothetical protein